MNPELQQTQGACVAGKSAIAELEHRAFGGDPVAVMALVEVARAATYAVHAMWSSEAPSMPAPFYNPFHPSKPPVEGHLPLAARREALHFWCGGVDAYHFPTFAYPVRSEAAKQQKRMLRGIQHGPWFGEKGNNRPLVQALMEQIVLPAFQRIRLAPPPTEEGIEREVRALPSLTSATWREWVPVIVRWLDQQDRLRLHEQGSRLYEMATNRRRMVLLNRKRNRLKAWLEERKKASGIASRPGDPVEKQLEPDDYKEYRQRKAKLTREMEAPKKATPAQIRSGLKEVLTDWLGNQFDRCDHGKSAQKGTPPDLGT